MNVPEAVLRMALKSLIENKNEWEALANSGDSGNWKVEDESHYNNTVLAIDALSIHLPAEPEEMTLEQAKRLAWEALEDQGWSEQRDAALLLLQQDLQTETVQPNVCPTPATLEMVGYFYNIAGNWNQTFGSTADKTHIPLYRVHLQEE